MFSHGKVYKHKGGRKLDVLMDYAKVRTFSAPWMYICVHVCARAPDSFGHASSFRAKVTRHVDRIRSAGGHTYMLTCPFIV